MEVTKYVIKAGQGKYYKSASNPCSFTADPLLAKTYKTKADAEKAQKAIKEYWMKNSRIYCLLTGADAPTAVIKKITITIVEEDA